MARFSNFIGRSTHIQPVETADGEWSNYKQESAQALGRLGRTLKVSAVMPIIAVGTLMVAGIAAPAMAALAPVLYISGSAMELKSQQNMTPQVSTALNGLKASAPKVK